MSDSFLIPVKQLQAEYAKGFMAPLIVAQPFQGDPWSIAKQYFAAGDGFFLDGKGSGNSETARFSYLGFQPFEVYQSGKTEKLIPELRRLFSKYRSLPHSKLPFFTGGACGLLSYELAHAFERLPHKAKDDLGLKACMLLMVRDLIVFDHRKKQAFFICNLLPSEDGTFFNAFEDAVKRVESCQRHISLYSEIQNGHKNHIRIRQFKADNSKQAFTRIVKRAKEYIKAGDIYQANLSQRFSFKYEGKPEALYESLRQINPSPFSCFIKIKDLVIASASPERLVKLEGRHCETRPIAGTRPRGESKREDKRLRRELMMSPKERAEHIMLVDLERNDLGRVCETGSVRVSELMTLEPYSHVVHIVSNVVGKLKKECDRFDLLKAVFPGGTITGCPKIRSMEIIEELEPFKRHFYTGSVGFFDFNGDMDLNIIIRSFIFHKGKGYFQVGAGIVHDSNPEAEYRETLHKAEALMQAVNEQSK